MTTKILFPSERDEIIVEVFSQAGDPAFVCGFCGNPACGVIEEVEEDLNDNRDFMERGDGRYLYSATWQAPQIGDEGRVELRGYWDLSLVDFKPLSA